MTTNSPDQMSLISLIRSAFQNVPHRALTLWEALDIEDEADEDGALEQYDAHWWEIPDSIIERYQSLGFLDTQDKLYYFPAYMTWLLRNYDPEATSPICAVYRSESADQLLLQLTGHDGFNELREALTPDQWWAIVEFLRFCARERVADVSITRPLERWWLKYAPRRPI